jgi:hypothetical protein
MSAIGSYEVLNRAKFDACIEAARKVKTTITRLWFTTRSTTTGLEEFHALWRASVLKTVDFDYAGWVIGQYLDAQNALNEKEFLDEESELGQVLMRIFTAAFVFDRPLAFPGLPASALEAYCREEYGEDGPGMAQAITAAHAFYAQGMKEITPENLVVFVIS